MKNKVLLSILLLTFIGCSENFDIDISFGESESINPGIDNAFDWLLQECLRLQAALLDVFDIFT